MAKRPAYRDALVWLANNDDCFWLGDGDAASASVTACLVADLFGHHEEKVTADLRRTLAIVNPRHPALSMADVTDLPPSNLRLLTKAEHDAKHSIKRSG